MNSLTRWIGLELGPPDIWIDEINLSERLPRSLLDLLQVVSTVYMKR